MLSAIANVSKETGSDEARRQDRSSRISQHCRGWSLKNLVSRAGSNVQQQQSLMRASCATSLSLSSFCKMRMIIYPVGSLRGLWENMQSTWRTDHAGCPYYVIYLPRHKNFFIEEFSTGKQKPIVASGNHGAKVGHASDSH